MKSEESFMLHLRPQEAVIIAGGLLHLLSKLNDVKDIEDPYTEMVGTQVLTRLHQSADGFVDEETLDVLQAALDRVREFSIGGVSDSSEDVLEEENKTYIM